MLNSATFAPSSLIAIALAAGIASVGAPAFSEPSQGLSTQISYRDLDLATSAGQAELQHRVRIAARTLCTSTGPDLTSGEALKCENQAVARSAEMQQRVIAAAQARTVTIASVNGR
jgi:UrcA family protein